MLIDRVLIVPVLPSVCKKHWRGDVTVTVTSQRESETFPLVLTTSKAGLRLSFKVGVRTEFRLGLGSGVS